MERSPIFGDETRTAWYVQTFGFQSALTLSHATTERHRPNKKRNRYNNKVKAVGEGLYVICPFERKDRHPSASVITPATKSRNNRMIEGTYPFKGSPNESPTSKGSTKRTKGYLRPTELKETARGYKFFKIRISSSGSTALNTALPATNTSTPASTRNLPVSRFTPPSTSIKA